MRLLPSHPLTWVPVHAGHTGVSFHSVSAQLKAQSGSILEALSGRKVLPSALLGSSGWPKN